MSELPLAEFIVFLFGAIFGSFANVVILRLPKGESIAFPGSHCQACKKPVKWYDNTPILAWFWLRGKCRYCKAPYSFRYVVVELITAIGFTVLFSKFGMSFAFFEYTLFFFTLVICSFIDLDHMILPDIFTLSGIVIGLIGSIFSSERTVLESFLGVILGGGFLWAIAYVYFLIKKEEGMGGGDIKLLGWIGAVLGWQAVPFVIIVSSLIGSFVGIAFAVKGKQGLKTAIPFGPFLAAAAILYIVGGQALGHWYLQLLLPALVE